MVYGPTDRSDTCHVVNTACQSIAGTVVVVVVGTGRLVVVVAAGVGSVIGAVTEGAGGSLACPHAMNTMPNAAHRRRSRILMSPCNETGVPVGSRANQLGWNWPATRSMRSTTRLE